VAKFRIATPAGASFTVAGGDYGYELEALTPIDAEIYEIKAGSEDEFVAAAKDADALYAKGRPITKRMIDGLGRCKIIALGSVGVDSVDVAAATAKGIPVTNCPDTFIEEVADHAMRLILATHGRLVEQDRLVREGRWAEGRPMLLKIPRLRGLTLGLGAGQAVRPQHHRLRPVHRRDRHGRARRRAGQPAGAPGTGRHHLDAFSGDRERPADDPRGTLPADEEDRDLHLDRARPDDR
jgi:D-3-phosphoglycerate dehydrogenase